MTVVPSYTFPTTVPPYLQTSSHFTTTVLPYLQASFPITVSPYLQTSSSVLYLTIDKNWQASEVGWDISGPKILADLFLRFYSFPVAIPFALFCVFINGFLLANLLIRPGLWSTINTFLSFLLVLNMIYGCMEFILSDVLLPCQTSDIDSHGREILLIVI